MEGASDRVGDSVSPGDTSLAHAQRNKQPLHTTPTFPVGHLFLGRHIYVLSALAEAKHGGVANEHRISICVQNNPVNVEGSQGKNSTQWKVV